MSEALQLEVRPATIKMNDVAEMFHAALFGYESASEELLGDKIGLINPFIVDDIRRAMNENGTELVGPRSDLKQAIGKIVGFYNNPDLTSGYAIKLEDDGTIALSITKCAFAEMGIHKSFRKDVVCPYAVILCAMLSMVNGLGGKKSYKVTDCQLSEHGMVAKIVSHAD